MHTLQISTVGILNDVGLQDEFDAEAPWIADIFMSHLH